MKKQTALSAMILGNIFLVSAIVFTILRFIISMDDVKSISLLSVLTSVAWWLAIIAFLVAIAVVAYRYFSLRKKHIRKLLVVGHNQPSGATVTKMISQYGESELLEPISIPADFIGDCMPKTKWQLQQLRGSWFLPSPKVLITFNAEHLQGLSERDLPTYLYDIHILVKGLSRWGKTLEVYLMVHNLQIHEGYESFVEHALDGEAIWKVERFSSLINELKYYHQKALFRLPEISVNSFIGLLQFNDHIDKKLEKIEKVSTHFQSLELYPRLMLLSKN
ncbi:hypothetical protein [Marinibactrum halimedae]|uniref:Uncharacterized protein n=1 Tax=Marinibactrum halimedae TaxID=1444977 RepID=A0AA37T887_9GAMM|nr:hypothetical protein [Marinibactrum halimedae]MCD9458096.1 hypothetical protein [Marinibactrum halimedae]GLS25030.1 hypothetical protein GCM10007877_07440 [Marinibactrum halimedae]